MTLLLLNLAPTHAVNVTIANMAGANAACGAAPGSCPRVEYRLSGPHGTDAPVVALNGAVLALDDDGRIPALALQGAPVPNATSTITVPPATITFAVLTGPGAASAAGC